MLDDARIAQNGGATLGHPSRTQALRRSKTSALTRARTHTLTVWVSRCRNFVATATRRAKYKRGDKWACVVYVKKEAKGSRPKPPRWASPRPCRRASASRAPAPPARARPVWPRFGSPRARMLICFCLCFYFPTRGPLSGRPHISAPLRCPRRCHCRDGPVGMRDR